jgi:hypothetical protein
MMAKGWILIILCFFPVCAYGRQGKWPNLNYTHAMAYLYNLDGNIKGGFAIIQDGKINHTVTSQGRQLSDEQTRKVISLINSNIRGLEEGLSKTFIPRHAIVFFDKKDFPAAAVMFDFNGESVRLYPEKKEGRLTRELSKTEIDDQLQKLAAFRTIIEELGYPVLASPFDYQKLKP